MTIESIQSILDHIEEIKSSIKTILDAVSDESVENLIKRIDEDKFIGSWYYENHSDKRCFIGHFKNEGEIEVNEDDENDFLVEEYHNAINNLTGMKYDHIKRLECYVATFTQAAKRLIKQLSQDRLHSAKIRRGN